MRTNRELDEEPHPVQIEILRNMSAQDRVALWNDLTRTTLEASFLNLKNLHPDESEQQLKYRFASLLYGEELAAQAYGKQLA